MALSIISNQAASIAARQLGQANDAATSTAEKLSSGKRVNSAADDAAASAIAARLSAEIAGLQTASVNAGQASSLLQIADGAFQNVEDILTRLKSLAVQAGSEQVSDSERAFLDQEFQSLKTEIDRIANDTEFNGTKLVNGSLSLGALNNFTDGNNVDEVTLGGVDLSKNGHTGSAGAGGTTGQIEISVTGAGTVNVSIVGFTAGGLGSTQAASGSLDLSTLDLQTLGNGNGTLAADAVVTVDLTDPDTGDPNGSLSISLNDGFDVNTAISDSANINGQQNLQLNFKVGTGTVSTEDEIQVNIGSLTTFELGITGEDITNQGNADAASQAVSDAIDALQAKRSEVGAAQNRLDFASQNVDLARENQEAARSELEDLNVATAITQFSQQQLLIQAGTSTLSQANSLPQNLLALFQ